MPGAAAAPPRAPWLSFRHDVGPARRRLLTVLALALPLAAWCALSYLPWLWHPLVLVADPGDGGFPRGSRVERAAFAAENARLAAAGQRQAAGEPANPVFLPAPHAVATALVTAFTTPPQRSGDRWLHESLLHSLRILAWGFGIAVVVGVPLGVLCGSLRTVARLVEPMVDFMRYLPPPAFGALMVAVFGVDDQPKVAIVVIATLFCTVLVVAKTVREVDPALIEAAQTLGARGPRLLLRVIVPAALPSLYNDLRLLLGTAWTALIVAELIGASSGISQFIIRQSRYFNFANVYAGILIIGVLGLLTDQALAFIGRRLFPWQRAADGRVGTAIWRTATWPLRLPFALARRARAASTERSAA